MKLILLYGAPAVGKYTVGKVLARKTKYKLIHIHSIYDFLEDVFGKERYEVSLNILNNICIEVFKQAAKNKIKGLVFTYAELTKDDFLFARRILRVLKKYRVDVYFVHLFCDKKELYKRVISKSRKKFRKTKNIRELDFLLSTKDYKKVFPASRMIRINTSRISPSDVVKEILSQISLN